MQILNKLTEKEMESIMKMGAKEIIEKLKQSGLTGRSGSNFLTGQKWEMTKSAEGKRVLICNADEGEPGAFKDRFIMENNLELLLQGISIGKKVLDADCFIYLRGEYEFLKKIIENKAKKMKVPVKVVLGAGAYICGEETALIESIEGKRGNPRSKPPYPTTSGLWKGPTCVNNVETLANIPLVLRGNWNNSLRLFSLSGDVEKPGIYEMETGCKISDIAKACKARNPKIISMGYSGGLIPYEKFKDLPVENKSFYDNSFSLGPCAMIFTNADIIKVLRNVSEFFVRESCGKCLPCREGCPMILEIIKKIEAGSGRKSDIEELAEMANYMNIAFCPLGRSFGFLLKNALKNFNSEINGLVK